MVAEAAGRDPNDLFLSPLMAYTQVGVYICIYVCVVPVVVGEVG